MTNTSALVLFSGGQDSTICLAYALSRFDRVETVGFDYGQRHAVELECRPKVISALKSAFPEWAPKLGEDHVCDVSVLRDISDTAMTSETEIVIAENGLPNTFVPGRNLMFLTLAGAIAWRASVVTNSAYCWKAAVWMKRCARPRASCRPSTSSSSTFIFS